MHAKYICLPNILDEDNKACDTFLYHHFYKSKTKNIKNFYTPNKILVISINPTVIQNLSTKLKIKMIIFHFYKNLSIELKNNTIAMK